MAHPKLSKLETQIMETLWNRGPCSIREIQEAFPASKRPAYTTVQTTVYRMLEGKKAVKIVRRVSNANIFDASISRDEAGRGLIHEVLSFFGGKAQPMMAELAEAGKLTLDDVRELERTINKLKLEHKQKGGVNRNDR
jgi:predicted transcriptional regulator